MQVSLSKHSTTILTQPVLDYSGSDGSIINRAIPRGQPCKAWGGRITPQEVAPEVFAW